MLILEPFLLTLAASTILQPAVSSQDSAFSVRSQQSIIAPDLPPESPPVFSVVHMEEIVTEDIKPKELTASSTQEQVSVTLLDSELWNEFSQAQNEMIITKVGRYYYKYANICGLCVTCFSLIPCS